VPRPEPSPLERTLAYHRRTKHHPRRLAVSLGYMDWDNQPDPFRRYPGAPLVPLDLVAPGPEPRYEPAFRRGGVGPRPVDRRGISTLFQDSLGLSAWKQITDAAGEVRARWALRVNPSSGNLHPTEGYLVCGPVPGLSEAPAVYHYAPREHALERRLELPADAWAALAERLPPGGFLVGLTSILWREAWKYGERAFRYCQHDVGHAVGAVGIAAAGLGWDAALLEEPVDAEVARLLGVADQTGVEAEHADGLIAVAPGRDGDLAALARLRVPGSLLEPLTAAEWAGAPNRLSAEHHPWPVIDEVAAATVKAEPPPAALYDAERVDNASLQVEDSPLGLRPIVHQRRSAVDLDGRTGITRDAFFQVLLKAVPGRDQVPFATLPWRPRVDLALFVHRVQDVDPGLYLLLRDPDRRDALEGALRPGFAWARPPACPETLPLYRLEAGDCRTTAAAVSCGQAIAADGAFAAAMLADFRAPLEALGPWFYRRLHWEAGLVGQVLYLEAEASGIRATGIGCFFDDPTHELLGLEGDDFVDLYHFTMGGSVDDPRLQTEPPYGHLERAR